MKERVLFADTGVQLLCYPLKRRLPATDGFQDAWRYCRVRRGSEIHDVPFVQWLVLEDKLFLAVDTTVDVEDGDGVGYFCRSSSLHGDCEVRLDGLLGERDRPVEGLELKNGVPLAFVIRPATASGGDPRDVHMVVDFGNNRTGALLLEIQGEIEQTPIMTPFELSDRFRLNRWNDEGEFQSDANGRWFSSKTYWCTTPYLPPPTLTRTAYSETVVERRSLLGTRSASIREAVSVAFEPTTFQEYSMARLGSEASNLALMLKSDVADVRTGVSSPKRYLWARDAAWLEDAFWYMHDPYQRESSNYGSALRGPLLRYLPESDDTDDVEPRHPEALPKPRHAPRTLMTAALYELLCQANAFVNSAPYRAKAGDRGRLRRLCSLSLTFPTGMVREEREEYLRQATRASKVFAATVGARQGAPPDVDLSIDEASAAQLTFLWTELQKVGYDAKLWFDIVGRPQAAPAAGSGAEASDATAGRDVRGPAGRRKATSAEMGPSVCIACIDIGGGTSDLTISRYTFEHGIPDSVRGVLVDKDGVNWAGDHLVKRLLECVVVPHLAEAIGIEPQDVALLFGPESDRNRRFRMQRIALMNRLLVPLAEEYLRRATTGDETEISHLDDQVVSREALDLLQRTLDLVNKNGQYLASQESDLRFRESDLEEIVEEVLGETLYGFCSKIVEHDADIVLLAGQPSKLLQIQRRVRRYLPLHASRVIPMHDYFAGELYPYHSADGRIEDPKSCVVVGAAVDFAARRSLLRGIRVELHDQASEKSFYWGPMLDGKSIQDRRIIFSPPGTGEDSDRDVFSFSTTQSRVLIGKKREPHSQATPVYLIRIDRGDRPRGVEVSLTLRRHRPRPGRAGESGHEERLELTSVDGTVDGEPARLGENVHMNWHTLASESYYLDTGGLDQIETAFRDQTPG
ncbi:MAG TPA: virulence factor SrfB [Pirellulaceae bacterium]|jgi:hypothetical protein|nr:virulence factor SrfB [Pirellulaceae bacterium]